jgi:hypothetical protein
MTQEQEISTRDHRPTTRGSSGRGARVAAAAPRATVITAAAARARLLCGERHGGSDRRGARRRGEGKRMTDRAVSTRPRRHLRRCRSARPCAHSLLSPPAPRPRRRSVVAGRAPAHACVRGPQQHPRGRRRDHRTRRGRKLASSFRRPPIEKTMGSARDGRRGSEEQEKGRQGMGAPAGGRLYRQPAGRGSRNGGRRG